MNSICSRLPSDDLRPSPESPAKYLVELSRSNAATASTDNTAGPNFLEEKTAAVVQRICCLLLSERRVESILRGDTRSLSTMAPGESTLLR